MQSFNRISPVESLMILAPLGVTGKTLMQYAILELLHEEVLETYEEWRYQDTRSYKNRKYIMVCKGKNFDKFRPHSFHIPFLEPFKKNGNALQVRSLISYAFKALKSTYNYKQKLVSEHLKANNILSNLPFLSGINLYILTKKGTERQKVLEQNVASFKQALQMKADKSKLKDYLEKTGANWLVMGIEEPDTLRELFHLLMFDPDKPQSVTYKDSELRHKGLSFDLIQHINIQFATFDFTFTGYETNFKPAEYKRFQI